MPDTQCLHCKRVGFVRKEVVVRAGESIVEHFCAVCESTWRVASVDRASDREPPRSLRRPRRK